MCGIAGYVNYGDNVLHCGSALLDMSDSLARRGPDDKGMWLCQHAAMVHRRLAVVDPENGKQPMVKSGGGGDFVLVYNGELYNTEDIRRELSAKGHTFTGHSDTEVLLLSYIEWGEECLQKFNGIFAFAIWDDKKQELFFARDRLGVKPFFYHRFEGGMVFGSELKTLLCHPRCKPVIGKEGIAELLMIGPGRTPGCGVFRGIDELKPAHCGFLDAQGIRISRYWGIEARPHTDSLPDTIAHVRELVLDAARRQLVSDVPICTFLSGGLDSSVLSALAAQELAKKGERLTTVSVDYVDNDKYFQSSHFQPDSDAQWINKMTEFLGTDHHNILLCTDSLVSALYEATEARDLPGMADVDSSLLLFCREIKKVGTVAISGECADEVFGGYPWYYDSNVLFQDSFPWSNSPEYRHSFLREGIMSESDAREYARERYLQYVKEAPKTGEENKLEARMKEMLYLNFNWFMETLLDRKDRMSMYSGLEVRVPYCDHRIVEYVYNVPWEMKYLQSREKGMLRKAMEGILPDDVLWRKKSPYPKTHNPAYLKSVKGILENIIESPGEPLFDIVSRKRMKDLLAADVNHNKTWYGQLMSLPQTIAYFIQLNHWLKKYKVDIQ